MYQYLRTVANQAYPTAQKPEIRTVATVDPTVCRTGLISSVTKPIEAKRKKTALRTEIRDEIGTTLQNSCLYNAVEYSLGFEIEEPPTKQSISSNQRVHDLADETSVFSFYRKPKRSQQSNRSS